MPITEFLSIRLLPPHTVSSLFVVTFLGKVSRLQAARSGYPVLYFQDTSSPDILYLVSGWESKHAHEAWIVGEQNQELMKDMQGAGEVKELMHLEIDFSAVPKDAERMSREALFEHGKADLKGLGGESNIMTDTNCIWESTAKSLEKEGTYRLRVYSMQEVSGRDVGHSSTKDSDGVLSMVAFHP